MPARLLIAGTACAIAAAVTVGLLLALAGGTGGTDRKAQDRALLSAVSAGLNWQAGAQSWAKAAAAAAVPTPEPPSSPTTAPAQAAPPAAAVEARPAEPPASATSQHEEQPPPPPPPVEWLDVEFSARVLAQLNAVREANGVPALATNGALTLSAATFSDTLTQLNILDHSAGGSLLARVQANGFYDNVQLGEVLWYATGAPSSSDPVNDWMGSPAHHDIILDPAYHQAGAGCYFRNSGSQLEVRCVVEVAG